MRDAFSLHGQIEFLFYLITDIFGCLIFVLTTLQFDQMALYSFIQGHFKF